MKIIKEFQNDKFAEVRSQTSMFYNGPPRMTWGLGDDGELYYKCMLSGHCFPDHWMPYKNASFGMSFLEMCLVVAMLR